MRNRSTQAAVRGRTVFLPGEISPVRAGEKSAEVIVVSDKPARHHRRLPELAAYQL